MTTILMAGMPNINNQFYRQLKKYPCEVEHTNADISGFSRDADAVVIIRSNINKHKADEVRTTYRHLNKPVFECSAGFSEIKAKFEEFMKSIAPTQQMLSPALLEDIEDDVIEAVRPQEEEAPPAKKHSPEMLEKIKDFVLDCCRKELSLQATIDALNKAKFTKADGRPTDSNDVARYRWHLRQAGLIDDMSRAIHAAPNKESAAVIVAAAAHINVEESAASKRLNLIGRVMNAALPPEKVLDLVRRIQGGEIDQEETLTAEEYRKPTGTVLQISKTSIFSDKKIQLLELTRTQAMVCAQVFDKIEDFATGAD